MRFGCSVFKTVAVLAPALCAAAASPVVLDPALAMAGHHRGEVVLWGGVIVGRVVDGGQTCVSVSSYPINRSSQRPETSRVPGQPFLACASGLDETNYAPGRQVSIAGLLDATAEYPVARTCADTASFFAFRQRNRQTASGCLSVVPKVEISDSKTWPDMPRFDPHPQAPSG